MKAPPPAGNRWKKHDLLNPETYRRAPNGLLSSLEEMNSSGKTE